MSNRRKTPAGRARRRVVIHYDTDDYSDIPVGRLASDLGVTVGEVEASIAEMVQKGFLTPRPDGSYDATIPDEVENTSLENTSLEDEVEKNTSTQDDP